MKKETKMKIVVVISFIVLYTIFYWLPAFKINQYEIPVRLEASLLALSLLFGWFGLFSISLSSLIANIHYAIAGHDYLYLFAPINFIVFAIATGAAYLFLKEVRIRFNDLIALLLISIITMPLLASYWAFINNKPFFDYFIPMFIESIISINIVGFIFFRLLKSNKRFTKLIEVLENE